MRLLPHAVIASIQNVSNCSTLVSVFLTAYSLKSMLKAFGIFMSTDTTMHLISTHFILTGRKYFQLLSHLSSLAHYSPTTTNSY